MTERRSSLAALVLVAAFLVRVPALSQADPPGRTVTLEEAVASATSRNALLLAAREEVAVQEGRAKEARSYFVPDLTFTENYSRTNNPVYVFMGKLNQASFTMNDFYVPALNNPQPLTNFQSRVELTFPLFTGGKLKAAYRAAALGVEAARDDGAFAESSVVKGVTQAFYGSLLARQAVAAMTEAVKTAESHLERVEAMHKQGLVLDSDLLRIRVFVADMRQQKASREADEKVARAYLAYAMGTEEDVAPAGNFAIPETPLPTYEEALDAALKGRGDLLAMTRRTEQAGQGVRMARADYLPQVGVMAAYEQDTRRWSPGAWGDNWMLGVQLRIPLFDGGARAGRLMSSKAQEIQAQQALIDLQRKVAIDVKEAWLRSAAARERVAVTTDSEAQARENLRIVDLRYGEGMASVTDLLDADTALTAAALQRSQAIHDLLVERAHLAWAMGKQ